uniref:NADH dehydrogenase subunit 4L n=1 Tax=Longicollum sp. (in: thorny-headed worms) TaxID=3073164 RepID=A0AA49K4X4_9BILA|nr:NADH dehydrogenase subunit 4L [Longicollum sp. (in: thorny-headed worms)]
MFSVGVMLMLSLCLVSGSLIGWLVIYEMVTVLYLVYAFNSLSMWQEVSEMLLVGVMVSVFVVAVVVSAYVRSLRAFGGSVVWVTSLGL